MRIRRIPVVVSALALLLSAACLDKSTNPDSDGGLLKSSLVRNTNPAVDSAVLQRLVAGNTAFACDMFDKLSVGGGNLVFS